MQSKEMQRNQNIGHANECKAMKCKDLQTYKIQRHAKLRNAEECKAKTCKEVQS